MIQSVRQQKKRKSDLKGKIILFFFFLLILSLYFLLNYFTDELDEFNCSIKNGPKAVTAIIFDKSRIYNNDQVADIKSSFNLWLSGEKYKPIDLSFFSEGTLLQLYVTDQNIINSSNQLEPLRQLCIPKDFKDTNNLIENREFIKKDYDNFLTTFSNTISELLEIEEGKSPLLETFLRISNSESFLKHSNKPHNLLVISDMLQSSDVYSHYDEEEGPYWNNLILKLGKNTIYKRVNLQDVNWQIFYAISSDNPKELNIQKGTKLQNFWIEFFKNSGANNGSFINIDG